MNCLSVFDHFMGLALKGKQAENRQSCSQKSPPSMFDRVLTTLLGVIIYCIINIVC